MAKTNENNVSITRPEYNEMSPIWAKNRAAEAGGATIKGAGETFLPKPNGQDDDDYNRYKKRAVYYILLRCLCLKP